MHCHTGNYMMFIRGSDSGFVVWDSQPQPSQPKSRMNNLHSFDS